MLVCSSGVYAPEAAVTSTKSALADRYAFFSAGLIRLLKATTDSVARFRDPASPFTHAPRITSG